MPFVRGPQNQRYEDFYETWRKEQHSNIEKLRQALRDERDISEIKELVRQVRQHYEYYYAAKTNADKQDVIQMMRPKWRTPLEQAFMWVAGWRPSMTFHLVYALSGEDTGTVLSSSVSPSMNGLSESQVERLRVLRENTTREEERVSYRLAELQQSLGDEPCLSTAMKGVNDEMKLVVDEKIEELEEIVVRADELRIQTLRNVLDVLDPIQAAQYLVGAGQVQMILNKMGNEMSGRVP